MNCTRAFLRRTLVVTAFAALLLSRMSAQQLTWTGGSNGTSQQLRLAANWAENTAPTENSDLYIASTINTTMPHLLVNAPMSARSFTFDNSAGKFSASTGLRIVATTSSSSSTQGYVFFNSATTIITALNNANASFRGASIGSDSTAVPLPSLTLDLNYSGLGTIDVRDTSIVFIADGSLNVPGATTIGTGGLRKIGPGTLRLNGNHTYAGGFVLDEGAIIITTNGTNTTTDVTSGAFGTGTLRLNNGSVSSNSTASRQILNSVVFGGGTITFGSSPTSGNINFVSTLPTSTITVLADTQINVVGASFWNQTIISDARLVKSGTGNLGFGITAATSTYMGGFELVEGNVVLNSSGSNGTVDPKSSGFGTGTLTLSGGAIISSNTTAGGGNRTLYNPIALNGTISLGEAIATSGLTVSTLWGSATTLIAHSTINTPGANITWNQDISGGFSLTKTGPAMLALGGINTYTGGTIVSEGILRGDAESIQGNVVNNAEIVFNETTGGTYAGVISGSGSVSKIGSATLTVSGVNTFVGGTTVSAGTLHLTGQLSSPVIVDGGTLSGSGRISSTATVGAAGRLAFTLPTSPAALTPLLVDDAVTFVEGATLEITGTDLTVGTVWTLVTANSFTGPLPQLALPTDWQGALAVVGQELRFTLTSLGATAFEAWRELHFGSSAVTQLSAADADPDGDGWKNLVEYALGLNPLASDGAAAIEHGTDNGRLKLTFNRLAEPDLTYVVEATDTLGTTWTAIWTSSGAQNTAGPVTVTDTVLLSSQPARFLRLRVETPTW
jgi:autotransporter-associated beta strand protein